MASTLTYQMAGCVLLTPQYVPEIVTHQEIRNAVSGDRHTQLVDTPEVELAVYGTLQVINAKQVPPQQGNISVNQLGNEPLVRMEKVAQAAFRLALKEQAAVAMGINFAATSTLSKQSANALLFGLLDARIGKQSASAKGTLRTVGFKLIYDHTPWVATISIEADPNNEKQLSCGVNFNINTPTKGDILLVRQASKLRTWFEQTVSDIVGEGSSAWHTGCQLANLGRNSASRERRGYHRGNAVAFHADGGFLVRPGRGALTDGHSDEAIRRKGWNAAICGRYFDQDRHGNV
jgi:hypothetical protein